MSKSLIASEKARARDLVFPDRPGRGRRRPVVEACDGRFTDHHARLARMLLDQIDELSAHIEAVTVLLDEAITALPNPATDPTETDPTGTDPTGTDPPRPTHRDRRWQPDPADRDTGHGRLGGGTAGQDPRRRPGLGPGRDRRARPGHDGVRL
ncbi:hypothetical protein E4P41_05460 [Geodermatophilus sp. DF01-2]|uniref:hypothetical protein n=1 Tax=Geodermatophilus sp. DF01-2 TaxID=2559610 RepID=UPI0010737B12|nr:hypothetical protein [Geodermatophilus sp. DF01_2]TFV63137.1 hypothetical protein E4P41_05460 [Geodermatophilus sp. DF01_2]